MLSEHNKQHLRDSSCHIVLPIWNLLINCEFGRQFEISGFQVLQIWTQSEQTFFEKGLCSHACTLRNIWLWPDCIPSVLPCFMCNVKETSWSHVIWQRESSETRHTINTRHWWSRAWQYTHTLIHETHRSSLEWAFSSGGRYRVFHKNTNDSVSCWNHWNTWNQDQGPSHIDFIVYEKLNVVPWLT